MGTIRLCAVISLHVYLSLSSLCSPLARWGSCSNPTWVAAPSTDAPPGQLTHGTVVPAHLSNQALVSLASLSPASLAVLWWCGVVVVCAALRVQSQSSGAARRVGQQVVPRETGQSLPLRQRVRPTLRTHAQHRDTPRCVHSTLGTSHLVQPLPLCAHPCVVSCSAVLRCCACARVRVRVWRSINVTKGPNENRILMTGLHTVADLYCLTCTDNIGWYDQRHSCHRPPCHLVHPRLSRTPPSPSAVPGTTARRSRRARSTKRANSSSRKQRSSASSWRRSHHHRPSLHHRGL